MPSASRSAPTETHPQASDALADLKHFKAKIDAGADAAITVFLQPGRVFPFRRCRAPARRAGADHARHHADRQLQPAAPLFRTVRCGNSRWISRKMQAYGDDAESVRAFGTEVVARLCQRLVEGGAPTCTSTPTWPSTTSVLTAARLKARHLTRSALPCGDEPAFLPAVAAVVCSSSVAHHAVHALEPLHRYAGPGVYTDLVERGARLTCHLPADHVGVEAAARLKARHLATIGATLRR